MVSNGIYECPNEYPLHVFSSSIRMLHGKELVHVEFTEGGNIEDVRLTHYGMQYISENPCLVNPINWHELILTVVSVISLLVSVIALFICISM